MKYNLSKYSEYLIINIQSKYLPATKVYNVFTAEEILNNHLLLSNKFPFPINFITLHIHDSSIGLRVYCRCPHTVCVARRTSTSLLTSTVLGLLRVSGSLFSSTAKFSGGRALRDGFLLSDPISGSNLRFRGVVFSGARFFFCRSKTKKVFAKSV